MKKTKHYIKDRAKRNDKFFKDNGFVYDDFNRSYYRKYCRISLALVYSINSVAWKMIKTDIRKNNINQLYENKKGKIMRVSAND